MLNALLANPAIDMVKTIAAFIVAIGILITVHEFGHFWAARRCGVQVLRFSIGFGKRLWGRTDKRGTEFVIALIPLGGYVKMLDERVDIVEPKHYHRAFNRKSIGQRAVIIIAGPMANFLFAMFMYWLILMMGLPGIKPIIMDVLPDSIMAKAGIVSNMELKSVNGIEIQGWNTAGTALVSQQGNVSVTLKLHSIDSSIDVDKKLNLSRWVFNSKQSDLFHSLGIVPVQPSIELDSVLAGSVAEKAGLKKRDHVVNVNGNSVANVSSFIQIIQQNPQRQLELTVERANKLLDFMIIPEEKIQTEGGISKVIGSIGVLTKSYYPEKYLVTVKYNPFSALYPAVKNTELIIRAVANELGNLLVGKRELTSLSGPGTIAKEARASAEAGMASFLLFLVFISVNLGLVNLFPLPVLDGGHLLFLAIEKVIGKPVSERVQDYSFRFGAIILILLMGLTFFN